MSNRSPVRGVIFDLDGTIVDTPHALETTFVDTLAIYGKNVTLVEERALALELQRNVAGREGTLNYIKNLNLLFKNLSIKGILRRLGCIRRFISIYHAYTRQADAYPGIPELLRDLKWRKYKIAIVTSSSLPELDRILTKVRDQIMPFIDVVVTRDNVKVVKPDPESILVAARQLNLDFNELVVVGDSWQDIRAVKAVNGYAIAVLWGFGTIETLSLEKPDQIVSNPPEIITILEKC